MIPDDDAPPPVEVDDSPAPRIAPPVERVHPADEEMAPHDVSVVPTVHLQPYRNGTNGTLPHSDESERFLLSCCFLDPAGTMSRCEVAQISPATFYEARRGDVYDCILGVWRRTGAVDIAIVAEELKRTGALERIGGWPFLTEVSSLVPTSIHAASLIEIVKRDALRREIIRLSTRAALEAQTGDPVEMLAEMEAGFRRLSIPTAIRAPLQSLTDFTIPVDKDRSILLGHRYLNRGDGMVMVGTSGIGKSSMSIQMAVAWALGRPAVGIPSNGPLRSLIIQSEDSDGDIAEMWASLSHVLKLPADLAAEIRDRVKIVNERVLRGDRFISSLAKLVELHQPDLVWINPLQAFIDGDVTDSQDLGRFLREGLNGLNNGRFGYVLVHHTTKPATGKDKAERLWHEVMYDMAGGAEIINWARAIISLRPAAEEGDFNLILAKRGRRAGVTRQVEQGAGFREEVVTTVPLKHAQGKIEIPGRARPLPIIYWEERAPDVRPETGNPPGGRPSKHSFDDYRNIFPPHSGPGLELAPLHRLLITNHDIPKKSLHGALQRWAEIGIIEIIQPSGKPTRYRMAV